MDVPIDFLNRYRHDPAKGDPVMKKKLEDRLRDIRSNNTYRSYMAYTLSKGRQATRDGNRDKFLKIFRDFKLSTEPKKYEKKFYDRLVVFDWLYKIVHAYLNSSNDASVLYRMGASYNYTFNGVVINTPLVISDFRNYRDRLLPTSYHRYTLERSDDPADIDELAQMELIDDLGKK
jgi:hypothetical protein